MHAAKKFIDYCHPDDGGTKFLQNVGSYKSHTALTSQKMAFFRLVCSFRTED
jgi:hypothetical protein